MAEKHKSKYKKPENAKPTRRKDLKDYTHDDKVGALNPYSTGKKQERVARKTDKAVQDDGKMFPKYTDKDRLYKKIEDGEYDPKHAMNVLRKRQDNDTDEYFDELEKIDHGVTTSKLKERINRLSTSQKEQLVREYVRRKIAKIIQEQGAPTDTPEEEVPAPEAGAEAPAPEAGATPPPPAAEVPAPAPTTPTPAPTPTQAPAPQTNAPEGQNGEGEEQSKEEQESAALKKVVAALTKEAGAVGKVEFIVKAIRTVFKDAEPADTKNFYKLLNRVIIKKLNKMSADQSVKKD